MAGVGKRTYLREVNPYLICPLCRGYLIDAITVVECSHSFCRSCILKHLSAEAHCPSCKHVLNKAKPNIKADKALQDIVYKLVPGLYHKEMRKRREFYKKHPEHADFATPEQRGEDVSGRLIFAPEDAVSLSLEYLPPGADPLTILLNTSDVDTNQSNSTNCHNNNNNNNNHSGNIASSRRYLQCPALVTIAHLKKFLALKYSVDMTRYTIEICHRRAPLPEHWTLMDVAYIYAWKRNAPMRFFYRVAQEEQRLEAPPHERPSTPGLGACLPPNDVVMNVERENNNSNDFNNHSETSRSQITLINDSNETSLVENPNKILNEKTSVGHQQATVTDKDKTNKRTSPLTISSSMIMMTNTTMVTGDTTTDISFSMGTCNDSNKQVKSPIKILKNPDGKYEVLKSPSIGYSMKEQTAIADIRPVSPEFSVVSIGNGQDSNGVKITLKQCSPTSGNGKKPKVISNVLLRCGQVEKNSSSAIVIQQLQRDDDKLQISQDKPEKQRRKVTFMDQSPPDKNSSAVILPKTALKIFPTEQQDKKQFLQSFQLTARESVLENTKLKASIQEISIASETTALQQHNATSKIEESFKKDLVIDIDEIKEKSNSENTSLNMNNSNTAASEITKHFADTSTNNTVQTCTSNTELDDANRRTFSSGTDPGTNVSNNSTKMDIYAFPSDSQIVPPGAVKRKCPPGLPIIEVKRKRQQIAQTQGSNKQNVPLQHPVKLSRNSSLIEHVISTNRSNSVCDRGVLSRVSNMNHPIIQKSNNPMLSNDTRNLLDGCGLSIPASLSITLTAPKSPGVSGPFVETKDSNDNRKTALGKVNPSITLNDRSVDPCVLKALKTGQVIMPVSNLKFKQAKQTDREANQQLLMPALKGRKREQESRDILDLSGGKKVDIHPLRIPQPITKFKTKLVGKDNLPGISDQGQVVTLMSGHRYYRAPPGSLTPAAHRVNDCSLPTSSRTPVYAPTGLSLGGNRTGSNLSSVFPSLQSLYALSQAPNLQQFQMDGRLRLPRTEGVTVGNGDAANPNINGNTPGKSHLAAQCAPVKPARSSVAPLAIPISKQQSVDKSASINISRTVSNDTSKSSIFRNSEGLISTDDASRLMDQTRHLSNIENTNKFFPRCDIVNNEQITVENIQTSNADSRNESIDTESSVQQRQQQQHEAASPRVSSTASPSPPPGDSSASMRNERNNVNDSDNINASKGEGRGGGGEGGVEGGNNTVTNTISNPAKNSIVLEVSSSKSPASPDSSSITLEGTTSKSCSTSIDQGTSTDAQTSNITKLSVSTASIDNNNIDESGRFEDKNKFTSQSDAKQLTSEMVQKRLLAVFPSNEWANNPIAAEHLGNFLKSLNATIKSEGHTEDSKAEKTD